MNHKRGALADGPTCLGWNHSNICNTDRSLVRKTRLGMTDGTRAEEGVKKWEWRSSKGKLDFNWLFVFHQSQKRQYLWVWSFSVAVKQQDRLVVPDVQWIFFSFCFFLFVFLLQHHDAAQALSRTPLGPQLKQRRRSQTAAVGELELWSHHSLHDYLTCRLAPPGPVDMFNKSKSEEAFTQKEDLPNSVSCAMELWGFCSVEANVWLTWPRVNQNLRDDAAEGWIPVPASRCGADDSPMPEIRSVQTGVVADLRQCY